MPINRSFEQFLADLDRRLRPGAPSQNKVIQKVQLLNDTVFFSSDPVTTFIDTNFPKVWAGGTVASSSYELAWGFGQWS